MAPAEAAARRNVFPCSIGTPRTEIRTPAGIPVFPFASGWERRLVEARTAALGIVFGDASGAHTETGPAGAAGHVYASRPGLLEAAQLYAFLTGRVAAGIVTDHTSREDVLVALFADLHSDRLAVLAERGTGIVCASTLDAARAAALANAAVARMQPVPSPTVRVVRSPRTAAAAPEAAAVRDALTAGADVLCVQAHCDGIDMLLHRDLILCSARSSPVRQPLGAPACAVTGRCHRLRNPVGDVLLADAVMFPHEIRARVLLLLTCWGALPSNAVVAPEWGILAQILDEAPVGAVVTSWTQFVPTVADLDRLVDALSGELPLGHAVAAFNAARGVERRVVLFGDPRMLIARPREVGAGRRPARERYERLPRTAEMEGKPVGRVLVDALVRNGNATAVWLPVSRTRETLGTFPCRYCGAGASHTWFALGVTHRRLVLCPRCGTVADEGERRLAAVRIGCDAVFVEPIAAAVHYAVVVRPGPADDSTILRGVARRPRRAVRIGIGGTAVAGVPVSVSVIIVSGAEFAQYGRLLGKKGREREHRAASTPIPRLAKEPSMEQDDPTAADDGDDETVADETDDDSDDDGDTNETAVEKFSW